MGVLEFIRKPTLRSLFLWAFLAFSIVPLLFYGLFMGYWSQSVFERDQVQRFAIEQNAAINTWEKIEKKIETEISLWAQSSAQLNMSFQSRKALEKIEIHPLVKEILIFDRVGDFVDRKMNFDDVSDQSWKKIIASFETRKASPSAKQPVNSRTPSSVEGIEFVQSFSEFRRVFDEKNSSMRSLSESLRRKLDKEIVFGMSGFSAQKSGAYRPWYMYVVSVRNKNKKLMGYMVLDVAYNSKHLDWMASGLNRDLVWRDAFTKKEILKTSQFRSDVGDPSIKFRDLDIQGQNRFVVFQENQEPREAVLLIRVPVLSSDYFKKNLWNASIVIAFFLGLGILYASVKLSKVFSKPLRDLVDATELISKGDLALPVESGMTVELQKLVDGFNVMARAVYSSKTELQKNIKNLESAHQELKQTQNQLIQSEKLSSLGQLVAGVAHELNNPIAFIYSNMTQLHEYSQQIAKVADLLEDTLSRASPDEREKAKAILKSLDWYYIVKDLKEIARSGSEGAQRVKDIVLGLRNFSRADSGSFGAFRFSGLVSDTLKIVQGVISKNIKLSANIYEDLEVEGNRSQLGQVLLNIVINAVQAVGKDGKVEVALKKVLLEGREHAQVEIIDNGPGVPPEVQRKMFDPFFTTKKIGEGTGLGLSIAYGIVQNHKGKISVLSHTEGPQKGTVFLVLLPLKQEKLMENKSDQKKLA